MTGAEELRALVRMMNATKESAFDDLSAAQIVQLLQACRALNLETLPDQLTRAEIYEVIALGYIPTATLHSLYEAAGEPKTGRDWEER